MAVYDYDLFVIGAGSGGVRAARVAAGQYGVRVGIAEEYRVGGTCVIRGCIPKKLFMYASHFREEFQESKGFGWQTPTVDFSWGDLIANKDAEIDRLNGLYLNTLKTNGVELHNARATLLDEHHIDLNGKRVSAERILVATGAWPYFPDIPGISHAIGSNEAFHLPVLPDSITIVGGGFVAVEFAGIFNGLGVDVRQIYRGDQILRGFDRGSRDFLASQMRDKGIDLRVETDVTGIEKTGDSLTLTLTTNEKLETDCVMYATGRWPNTRELGLENAGVELNAKGAILVDDYSRTNIDNIYAVGDVTDRLALTPVAIREGHAFVDSVYGGEPTKPDHDLVPEAIFSQPPYANIGMTEEEAFEKVGTVDVYESVFRPLKHTLSGSNEKVFTKLLVDVNTDKILGVHMVGMDAPEIIQALAIAVKMGATKSDFDATTALHPSTAEEFVLMREKRK